MAAAGHFFYIMSQPDYLLEKPGKLKSLCDDKRPQRAETTSETYVCGD